MRTTIVIAILILAVAPAAAGDETARAETTWEAPWTPGAFLRVENLVGSITVDVAKDPGTVRVEARVVAEAEDADAARALADAVRLDVVEDDRGPTVRASFPVDRHGAFRAPRAESGGFVGRVTSWVTPLVRKKTVAVEWAGRPVQVGDVKGAVSLAVHLHVSIPLDAESEFRQVLGTVDVARLRGTTTLDVVEGRAESFQCYGSLTVRTGGGDAAVRTFKGETLTVETLAGAADIVDVRADAIRLRSAAGAILARDVTAESLEVASGEGDVEMTDVEPRTLDVRCDGCAVDLGTRLKRTREASIVAGRDVTLRVGDVTPFDLVASAGKGGVRAKGVDLEQLDTRDGGTTLRRGSGGIDVVVRADRGSVTVRPLR